MKRILLLVTLLGTVTLGFTQNTYYSCASSSELDGSDLSNWTDVASGTPCLPVNNPTSFTADPTDEFIVRTGSSITSGAGLWEISGTLNNNGTIAFTSATDIATMNFGTGVFGDPSSATISLSAGDTVKFGDFNMLGGVFIVNAELNNNQVLELDNYNQTGGVFNIQTAVVDASETGSSVAKVLVNNSLTITDGNLDLNAGTDNNTVVGLGGLTGVIEVQGQFNYNGGRIGQSGVVGDVVSEINFTNSTHLDIATDLTFQNPLLPILTSNESEVNFSLLQGTLTFVDEATVIDGSTGVFTMSSTTGLNLKHSNGLNFTNNNALTNGCIEVTGTRTYVTDGDYEFSGLSAQITGNEFPIQVNNLVITNSAANGVEMTGSIQHDGDGGVILGKLDFNSQTLDVDGTVSLISNSELPIPLSGIVDLNDIGSKLNIDGTFNYNGTSTFEGVDSDGSEVEATATGIFNVNGDNRIIPQGTWVNGSNINFYGNIDPTSSAPSLNQLFGHVLFHPDGNQMDGPIIQLPDGFNTRGNLIYDNVNSRRFAINGNARVGGLFDFGGNLNHLALNGHVLKVLGAIVNGGSDRFFLAGDLTSRLARPLLSAAGDVVYQVGFEEGASLFYRPVLAQYGSFLEDTFAIGISKDVYTNGSADGTDINGIGLNGFYDPEIYKVSNKGVGLTWYIDEEVTASTSGITFTLAWDPSDELTAFLFNNAHIDHYYDPDGLGLEIEKWNFATGENRRVAHPSTLVSGLRALTTQQIQTSFSPWSIASGSGPLPIELISFEAKPVNSDVEVAWVTAMELDHDYYVVERSTKNAHKAFNFQEVGKVNSSGNSDEMLTYKFIDEKVGCGLFYYRLKSVDKDGATQYSEVQQVELLGVDFEFSAYPNPVSSNLHLELTAAESAFAQITIIDINGKRVNQVSADITKGVNEVEIDMNDYNAGYYFVDVEYNNSRFFQKIFKR